MPTDCPLRACCDNRHCRNLAAETVQLNAHHVLQDGRSPPSTGVLAPACKRLDVWGPATPIVRCYFALALSERPSGALRSRTKVSRLVAFGIETSGPPVVFASAITYARL